MSLSSLFRPIVSSRSTGPDPPSSTAAGCGPGSRGTLSVPGTASGPEPSSYAGAVDQRTVSAAYSDKRLAVLYDALNPPGPETAFYLGLAREASARPGGRPARVLDMGCGTGRLACEFATRGHQVTGADPAAAMLDVARARPGGDRVRWIETDAVHLAEPTRFDLIVLTGHVFQLLLDDRDVRAALRTLSQQLAPGGRLAFETRNPAAREWQDWNPQVDHASGCEADGLAAEVHYDISGVSGELVRYETWFRFADGEVVVATDTLRFLDQAQVAGFLAGRGPHRGDLVRRLGPVTRQPGQPGDHRRRPVGEAGRRVSRQPASQPPVRSSSVPPASGPSSSVPPASWPSMSVPPASGPSSSVPPASAPSTSVPPGSEPSTPPSGSGSSGRLGSLVMVTS